MGGALVSLNPFYKPHIPLGLGIVAGVADFVLVLILSAHPLTARAGILLAGLCLAVPCFLRESALWRCLLMWWMVAPLAIAATPLLVPAGATYRERLGYLFTWLGEREVKRRSRCFATPALFHLIAATLVLTAMMAVVKAGGNSSMPVRWLAGGFMILAGAEMLTAGQEFTTAFMGVSAPALMRSPFLSRTVGEFWTSRWNPAASLVLFRTLFFAPVARRGPVLALWIAFAASGVAHALLAYMATGRWGISFACGAFFLTQPPFILAEKRLKVRRWRPANARVWTFSALAMTSPLFVEPALQIIEPSWGAPQELLMPTLGMLGFVLGVSLFVALGSQMGSRLDGEHRIGAAHGKPAPG